MGLLKIRRAIMLKETFITSYLAFYLKGEFGLDGDFVKLKVPNTILKVVPLGAENKTVAISQIASVEDSFKLELKPFLIGILVALLGLGTLSSNLIGGLVFTAYGVLSALSSFQTVLSVNTTAGQSLKISFVVFEKSKALGVKETIEKIIAQRHHDTNVRVHTQASTEAIVNAINNK